MNICSYQSTPNEVLKKTICKGCGKEIFVISLHQKYCHFCLKEKIKQSLSKKKKICYNKYK